MQAQSYEFGNISVINEYGEVAEFDALCKRIALLFELLGESDAECCILLIDDAEIRALNAEWRDVDAATDVLSFPMREGEDEDVALQLPLGDIAISVDRAKEQAKEAMHRERLLEVDAAFGDDWSVLEELSFLVVHGVLHLLGYDHATPEQERAMRARELELMAALRLD
ncbi:MAG: rRNA maturation RNase YbeY [Bradymonadales bacterium]|jgi:probable rRNA maturation factor